jgi:cell wall-associated NlpC family hydrolase
MCRSHRRRPCGQSPRRLIWLLPIMLASAQAWAAPEPQSDPLYAVLAERGALPAAPRLASTLRDRAAEMVVAAMNFVGVPYQHGGNDFTTSFDCSGFTRHIVGLSLGLILPRRVDDQASAKGLVAIDKADLRPGDLVFFNTLKRSFSHVGIYVGDGRFIHAPRSGSEVRIEDMRYAYWAQRFTGARRVALAIAPALPAAAESTLLHSGS